MFYSLPPYHDLIFQDATRQLQVIPPNKRRFDLYLGSDFMRAKRITDCNSGAGSDMLRLNVIRMEFVVVVLPMIVLCVRSVFV